MVIPRVTRHGYGFFAGLNSHTRTRTHGKTRAKPAGIPVPVTFTNRMFADMPRTPPFDVMAVRMWARGFLTSLVSRRHRRRSIRC